MYKRKLYILCRRNPVFKRAKKVYIGSVQNRRTATFYPQLWRAQPLTVIVVFKDGDPSENRHWHNICKISCFFFWENRGSSTLAPRKLGVTLDLYEKKLLFDVDSRIQKLVEMDQAAAEKGTREWAGMCTCTEGLRTWRLKHADLIYLRSCIRARHGLGKVKLSL
jgi:hypothetical protein